MLTLRNIKKCVQQAICAIFRILPIDPKLIIFQGNGECQDNSQALFEYVYENSDYQFVWFVNNPQKYKKKRVIYVNSYKPLSILSLYYFSRAHFVFSSHGRSIDIKARKGQKLVNLWHGIPMKLRTDGHDYNSTDIISTGPNATPLLSKFIGAPISKFRELGYPRNDILVDNNNCGRKNPLIDKNYNKVIIWMPTFRSSTDKKLNTDTLQNETGLPIINTVHQLVTFNEFLKVHNTAIILKLHYLQQDFDVFHNKFSNIIIISDNDLERHNLQLYAILGKTDALLTDYSSVSYDYLLVNKPIGYIIDDIEKYKRQRGFIQENITEFMAGHLISKYEDLLKFVEDISNNRDNYIKERQELCSKIHKYHDSLSRKRITKFFNI